MFRNPPTKLHNLQLAIVFKIRNHETETEKMIICQYAAIQWFKMTIIANK